MKCSVMTCNNSNEGKASELSFFVFPSNPVIRKKWISFCRRKKEFKTNAAYICMLHFKPDDIENRLQYEMGFARYRLLKRDAIPTIFNPNDKRSEQRESRVEKRENHKIVESILKESYGTQNTPQRHKEVEIITIEDDESSSTSQAFETWAEHVQDAGHESLPILKIKM